MVPVVRFDFDYSTATNPCWGDSRGLRGQRSWTPSTASPCRAATPSRVTLILIRIQDLLYYEDAPGRTGSLLCGCSK